MELWTVLYIHFAANSRSALFMKFLDTELARPGTLWRSQQRWRKAVHVVATVTVITEQQLILYKVERIQRCY